MLGGTKKPPDKPVEEGMVVEDDDFGDDVPLAEVRRKLLNSGKGSETVGNRVSGDVSINCHNSGLADDLISNRGNSRSEAVNSVVDSNGQGTSRATKNNVNSVDKGSGDNSREVSNGNFYDFQNRYRKTDSGPYFVYIEHSNKNLGRLFPIRIGHYLLANKFFANNVVDIKAIGLNRIKVILKSHTAANQLVVSEIIKNNNLVAYIPRFFTQKKGVVKMVDTYFTEDYLKTAIQSDVEVIEVKRMYRKVFDDKGESKLVPRQMVVVAFLGSTLPANIQINLTNFPVEPYIHPVVQCYSCLRYGHTSRMCKGSNRCKGCGGDHHIDECDEEVCCIHCNSKDHTATSRACPEYKKQMNIKKTMALENVSFVEARKLVNNPSYAKITTNNRFALLSDLKDFPPLPESLNTQSELAPRQFPGHSVRRSVTQPLSPAIKKRKVYNKSPVRSHQGTDEPSTAPAKSILPNPYRNDFILHKEKLIEQITVLFINLMRNILPETSVNDLDNELNIKQQLSSIFVSLYPTNNVQP